MNWKYLKLYDWESIVKTILFSVATVGLFFFLANQGHFSLEFAKRNMQMKTSGYIINKYSFLGNSNTLSGTRPIVNGLQVNYTYEVGGITYNQYQLLKYSVIDAPHLNYINKTSPPIKIIVMYNKKPSESSLAL